MLLQPHTSSRAFTLVEVITVVAIISILASVVIANMGRARQSARDKFAMATMQSMIIEASLYRANNASGYTGLCNSANSDFASLGQEAADAVGQASISCADAAAGFEAQLELMDAGTYCIDGTKFFGLITSGIGTLNNDC